MSIRLSKIYTRGGDKGTTALVGGARVSKGCSRLETYGSVDELNAQIGVVRTYALAVKNESEEVYCESKELFSVIQNRLFDVGSILATPPDSPYEGMPQIDPEDIQYLESKIDFYNESLEVLNSFTLPGGGLCNAHAHVARTVCRRVERILVRYKEEEQVAEKVISYINRLSDLLYVYSRWVSLKLHEDEFLWERK